LQGDGLAAALFDLAWTFFLHSLSLPPGIISILVHDDTHLIHENLDTLLTAFLIIASSAPLIGLEFNLNKSTLAVLCRLTTIPPHIILFCDRAQITLCRDILHTIGTYITLDNNLAKQALTTEATALELNFSLIRRLPIHIAVTFLRYCHGNPNFVYLLRAHYPCDTIQASYSIAKQTDTTIKSIHNTTDPNPQLNFNATLPLRHAGLGILSPLNTAIPASFACLALLANSLPDNPPTPLSNPRLFSQIDHMIRYFRVMLEPALQSMLPPSAADFYTFFAPNGTGAELVADKFQRKLSHGVEATRFTRRQQRSLTPTHRAALVSAKAKYSAAFITNLPSPKSLSQNHFAYADFHRLYLPPNINHRPHLSTCHCGQSLDDSPWHMLHCKPLINSCGFTDTSRHNCIRDDILCLIRSLGGTASAEPRVDPRNPLSGPDISVLLGPDAYHLDVSIVHAYSPTEISAKRAFSPVKPLEHVETKKITSYGATSRNAGAELVPVILNTHGGFGPSTVSFCAKLALFASEHSHTQALWTYDSAYSHIIQAIVYSFHTHNGRLIDACLSKLREVSGEQILSL